MWASRSLEACKIRLLEIATEERRHVEGAMKASEIFLKKALDDGTLHHFEYSTRTKALAIMVLSSQIPTIVLLARNLDVLIAVLELRGND